MKNTLFTLILLIGFTVNAQFGGTVWNENIKDRFLKSKLLIPRTGNEQFDKNLEQGFTNHWKLTEFEMVDSDYEIDTKDENMSYLVDYELVIGTSTSVQSYLRYGIFVGGDDKEIKRLVAEIVFDVFGRESKIEEAAYRAGGMASMMQNYIQMRIDDSSISWKKPTYVQYVNGEMYNKNVGRVTKKTLLVDRAQLAQGDYSVGPRKLTFTEEDFKLYYGGKVEFVSTEELEEAINSGNPDYCYFLPIYSRSKNIFVVDCESGEVWYNGYSIQGMFFTQKDLVKLGKLASK